MAVCVTRVRVFAALTEGALESRFELEIGGGRRGPFPPIVGCSEVFGLSETLSER